MEKFRLGILGTCNVHAQIYSEYFNTDVLMKEYFGLNKAEVKYIFGFDKVVTKEIAGKYKIVAVDDPAEMVGEIDAAMILFRNGKYHAEYALPFINQQTPVFIDKPFSLDVHDAQRIVHAAQTNGTLIMGGSSMKYCQDVLNIRERLLNIGKIKTAFISFEATLENEFGGLPFYGSHLAEIVSTLFGCEYKSITAFSKNNGVNVVIEYSDFNVQAAFVPKGEDSYVIIYGENENIIKKLDISLVFKNQMKSFMDMLDSKIQPKQNLVEPVKLVSDILLALKKDWEKKI